MRACDRYASSARLSRAARARSFHFDSSPSAMSSGSSIIICMIARTPLSIVLGATFQGDSDRRIQYWLMPQTRYPQVPGFSSPEGTPLALVCDRPPFRRERVSLAADFRGAGSAFPTDGIVTRSNSS